jgi:hypothetical protein
MTLVNYKSFATLATGDNILKLLCSQVNKLERLFLACFFLGLTNIWGLGLVRNQD